VRTRPDQRAYEHDGAVPRRGTSRLRKRQYGILDFAAAELLATRAQLSAEVWYHLVRKRTVCRVANIRGDEEESYGLLEEYARRLRMADAANYVQLETKNGGFLRMFVCFAPMREAFPHLRHVFAVDGAHLRAKYLGVILAVTGKDAAGKLLILCSAIVAGEDSANWRWFFSHVSLAFGLGRGWIFCCVGPGKGVASLDSASAPRRSPLRLRTSHSI
jgi:hypothetical protein